MPEKNINEIFIENLNKYLNAVNMTYSELADKLNVSKSTVSMWINKKSLPRMEILDKIADLFNVSTANLLVDNKNYILKVDGGIYIDAKDEKDIAKDLENIMEKLESGEDGPVRFNGQDIDDDTLLLFRQAIELGLTQLKIKNKELYNPNKNKNKKYNKNAPPAE